MRVKRSFVDNQSTLDAKFAAQKLAFGPLMFQAARVLRDTGALLFLKDRGQEGCTPEELAEETELNLYASRVLLEAALAAEMVVLQGSKFALTKLGYLVLMDPMTRVNMDFVHDVCYRAFFHLAEAIETGKPAGLRELGDWETIYEGLSQLPEQVQKSWFAFDHYYSDGVFGQVLPLVFERKPDRILDVGGNTGKWAMQCCNFDPEVQVTVVDLPGQLTKALENAGVEGFGARVSGCAMNVLAADAQLPRGHDAIWMSQFLDCFSEEQIVHILRQAAQAMTSEARLYVLETFWDRQRFDAARFSVINTSLYFTAVANGNSKMYHSDRMKACLEQAGLVVEHEVDEVGISHSLLVARLA